MTTIEKLAIALDVDVEEVARVARQALDIPAKSSRNINFRLNPDQCRRITDELFPPSAASRGLQRKERLAEHRPSLEPLPIRNDRAVESGTVVFNELNHKLWVHPDVIDTLHQHALLSKRLGIVLQHLGAHGRTSVVKGCSDNLNKGWLRSPLGGSNGMQYYLWWAPQGNEPVKTMGLHGGSIVIRAVRHHDHHAPLKSGDLSDYLPFHQREINDETLVGKPWSDEQLEFIDAVDPVRIIQGQPGSGKTTVLWKAIEARSNQRVLYLTWSRALTVSAHAHFKAFAPANAHVDARDFLSFLSALCQTDIKRLSLQASQSAFLNAIASLQPNVLGPWTGRHLSLFAEMRAFVFGRAIPNEDGFANETNGLSFDPEEYIELRGGHDGVGPAAARALVKTLRSLDDKVFATVFPELAAAAEAIQRLRLDDIPNELLDLDRVVVDEVQDLTLIEIAVCAELCRAVARHRGYAPWLLLAGDEGQTVRPSGFDWGRCSELIARQVGTPRKFCLDENLRCPARIAGVLERASERYAQLDKVLRPSKQRHRRGGQHVDAQLIHIDARTVDDATEMLAQLDNIEGVVVISPESRTPTWVPAHLSDLVLSPADAKGLEYQAVLILDPGTLLAQLDQGATDDLSNPLNEHNRRTAIDQFRVALSRATETLVFVDVNATQTELDRSRQLLGTPTPFDPEELPEHLSALDATPEEMVLARTRDARALVDERPQSAWRRAYQALCLLGDPGLPNGVSSVYVRLEVCRTLLEIAARFLLDGMPETVTLQHVEAAATEALGAFQNNSANSAFRQLRRWANTRPVAPFELLDAIIDLGDDSTWIRTAIAGSLQQIRRSIELSATDRTLARNFAGNVEGWLEVAGFAKHPTSAARELRLKAFHTLLLSKDLRAADQVLARVVPTDYRLLGQLRQAQGFHEQAAEAYEGAGEKRLAFENWRLAGRWERALPLSELTVDTGDLQWLASIEAILERRPPGHSTRLTPQERDRLSRLLGSPTINHEPTAISRNSSRPFGG
jgi:hypothetical protein